MKRILYFALILAVALGTVKTYALWWDRQSTLTPELVTAKAHAHTDLIPAKGILIWREEVISARTNGLLSLPSPGPRRVGKGEVLAVVKGPSGTSSIRAEKAGYFLPALDGAEGKWSYSSFWSGMASLPAAPSLVYFQQQDPVERGKPLGKLIPQPQDLRCILYADLTPALERDIRSGVVKIVTGASGRTSMAEVRVYNFEETKAKLYVTLPFFPLENVLSREIPLVLEAGERMGVTVPESAVVHRDGKLGVLALEGSMVRFRQVAGIPVEGKRFFISSGLLPGSLVVLRAEGMREGKIHLW